MKRRDLEQTLHEDLIMWHMRVYSLCTLQYIADLFGMTKGNVQKRLDNYYMHVENGIKSFNSFDDKRS